jgi:hypothetical protein
MVASEANRPLIYAAYYDKNLVNSFAQVYEFLRCQKGLINSNISIIFYFIILNPFFFIILFEKKQD